MAQNTKRVALTTHFSAGFTVGMPSLAGRRGFRPMTDGETFRKEENGCVLMLQPAAQRFAVVSATRDDAEQTMALVRRELGMQVVAFKKHLRFGSARLDGPVNLYERRGFQMIGKGGRMRWKFVAADGCVAHVFADGRVYFCGVDDARMKLCVAEMRDALRDR